MLPPLASHSLSPASGAFFAAAETRRLSQRLDVLLSWLLPVHHLLPLQGASWGHQVVAAAWGSLAVLGLDAWWAEDAHV